MVENEITQEEGNQMQNGESDLGEIEEEITALSPKKTLHPKFIERMGKGRAKGAKNKKTLWLESQMPELKEFLERFPADRQAEVKNYVGFKRLLEANEMVDLEAKAAERFRRRLEIIDRTLPKTQEIRMEKHETYAGRLDIVEELIARVAKLDEQERKQIAGSEGERDPDGLESVTGGFEEGKE